MRHPGFCREYEGMALMVTKGYGLVFALLMVAALALVGPVAADEHVVTWPGAGPTTAIQTAVDAASDGDTIVLSAGTYSENGITITGKSLTIRSASGNRADTIIDGTSASPRIFTVTDGSSLTIENLTLQNGRAPNGANGANGATGLPGTAGSAGENGGAILSAGPVTITSSTITGCSAGKGGKGGMSGAGTNGNRRHIVQHHGDCSRPVRQHGIRLCWHRAFHQH